MEIGVPALEIGLPAFVDAFVFIDAFIDFGLRRRDAFFVFIEAFIDYKNLYR